MSPNEASFEGVGSGYSAGGKVDGVRTDGARRIICKLDGKRAQDVANRPTHLGVCMWYRPIDRLFSGTLDVVGFARWATGRGASEAEFDVSAWGTQLSLTGGADFIELGCFATGDAIYADQSPVQISVQAMISLGDVGHVPATRTIEHVMPADSAVEYRIPTFGRAAYLLATDLPNVLNVNLDIYADNPFVGPAPTLIATLPWTNSTRIVVPFGAHFYGFSRAAGAWLPNRLRTVWELAL